MTAALVVTDAGRALLADGENRGLRAVTVTRLAAGDGTGAADAARTALRSERDSAAATGSTATPGRIALRADVQPTGSYGVTEIGVFGRAGADGDETLLWYWSAANAAAAAAAAVPGSPVILAGAVDIVAAEGDVTVTPDVDVRILSSPDATTTARGIVELATFAEARAGADNARAVTPAGLHAAVGTLVPEATTATAGKAEIATAGEADQGTDDSRIMTPAKVKRRIDAIPSASTGARGLIETANAAEAAAGNDDSRAMTPAQTKALLDSLRQRLTDLENRPVGSSIVIARLAADRLVSGLPVTPATAAVLTASVRCVRRDVLSISGMVEFDPAYYTTAPGQLQPDKRNIVPMHLEARSGAGAWRRMAQPVTSQNGKDFHFGTWTQEDAWELDGGSGYDRKGEAVLYEAEADGVVQVRLVASRHATRTAAGAVIVAPTADGMFRPVEGGEGTALIVQRIPAAKTD